MLIDKQSLIFAWQYGKTLTVKKKEYSVHRMSYGDFFLEPAGHELNERQGFAKGTKHLYPIPKTEFYTTKF